MSASEKASEPSEKPKPRTKRWSRRLVRVVLGALVLVLACVAAAVIASGGTHPTVAVAPIRTSTEDPSELCVDLLDVRACWGSGLNGLACAGGVCVSSRVTPSGAAPEGGWRCAGHGAERVCRPRRRNASPFVCDARGTCIQHEPRLPGDGEWECIEADGVTQCHATAKPSGVVPGADDLGWTCGRRTIAPGAPDEAGKPLPAGGENVCVDFSPDRPDGDVLGWKCLLQFFPYASVAAQVCTRSKTPMVGDACTDTCPKDASCVAGRCVPPKPSPTCWLDGDCGAGKHCRWGTCEDAPR